MDKELSEALRKLTRRWNLMNAMAEDTKEAINLTVAIVSKKVLELEKEITFLKGRLEKIEKKRKTKKKEGK